MNAKQLQIDDWIYANDTPVQVTSLNVLGGDVIGVLPFLSSIEQIYAKNVVALSNGAGNMDKLKPIPLTIEMLKEWGFCEITKNPVDDITDYWLANRDFELRIVRGTIRSYIYDKGFEVKYVHQLQHLLRDADREDIAEHIIINK